MRGVCVTGLGVFAPIGDDVAGFAASLAAGRSGIRALQSPFAPRVAFNAAGIVGGDPAAVLGKARIAALDRVTALALVAAREAVTDAGLGAPGALDEAAVYVGTGMGGQASIEASYEELMLRGAEARINPLLVVKGMNNAAAAGVALDYRCHGPNLTFSTACSSSALAIGEAGRLVASAAVDIAIVGGTEALLTLGMFKAWEAMRTLAVPDRGDPSTACRPFAADRTGLVLAEGAAFLVLESESSARRRGARVHARLTGYGARNDATHLTKPDVQGQCRAMQAALDDAGIGAGDIGYINAHGTATIAGDLAETESIKQVFGAAARGVPVSSTKSMHGHLIGAAGALELIAALLVLRDGVVPPTINLHRPDPACDLDYVPNVARRGVRVDHVMSNSFAFGGSNAVLIASRGDD
ncbi:MAG TPA: beta-ketoacyl-[acyl-carrier-protein] synthase family protein [Burkholderiaceae bacterium]|nr:beta-ketoacyl-[acyl-carrier-protein] synthase family protein [Burkholderiaceae bacterium]